MPGIIRFETHSAEIWKPLLRRVGMPMFLVIAKLVQRPGSKYANNGTEDIGLLIINLNQLAQCGLHIIDGAPYGRRLQPWRKGDVG